MVASDAPETALDDDAVVGAETARATVEALDEGCDPLLPRALRGDATAEAGLAQAVRRARCEEDAERGATTLELEQAAVLAEIMVLVFWRWSSLSLSRVCVFVAFVRLSLSLSLRGAGSGMRGKKRKEKKGSSEKERRRKKKKKKKKKKG